MKRQLVFMGFTVFACLTLVFSYGIAIFGFLFPAPMISFMDSLGASRAALMFSERRLSNSDNLEHLLDTLNRNIDAQRHNRIITLTEQLISYKTNPHQLYPREQALADIHGWDPTIFQHFTRALINQSQYQRAADFAYEFVQESSMFGHLPVLVFEIFGTQVEHQYVGTREPRETFTQEFDRWFNDKIIGALDLEPQIGTENQRQSAMIFRDLVILVRSGA